MPYFAPNPPPVVVATTPANGATDFPAAGDLIVGFSESVSLASGAFTLACTSSGNVALSYPGSGANFTISTGTALQGGESCLFTVVAGKVSDAERDHRNLLLHRLHSVMMLFAAASASLIPSIAAERMPPA